METPTSHPDPSAAPTTDTGVILAWWGELADRRGDRAALRRCATPAEVAFQPGFHRLLRRLDAAGHSPHRAGLPWLACLTAVLAHVDEAAPAPGLAAQLGTAQDGKVPMSSLRFRRLLAVDDPAELQVALVRAIRLLDGRAAVPSLCRAVLRWNDSTRRRWAHEYYRQAPEEKASR